jgi:hypothetical protein
MSVMTAEQRKKRIERAQAEVDKLGDRVQRLTNALTDARISLAAAQAELDWWQRPVGEQPQTKEEPPA